MKIKKRRLDRKSFLYQSLAFFLFAPLFLNLVGNLIAISGQYTFYYLGYNSVAIASRFIENTIFNISGRVLLLALTSLSASALMYFIYYYAKRGKVFFLIVGVLLYAADFTLAFHPAYLEGVLGTKIANFIHLLFLILIFVVILARLLNSPIKRGYYDYA